MYSITPSLYSAWYWYKNSEKSSREDFLNKLNKVSTPPTQAMQAGIKFEKDVRLISEHEEGEIIEDPILSQIVNIIKGGVWQKTCKKEFGNYLLSGRMDVWTESKIYDIKYTDEVQLKPYYDYSIQHLLYMYCTGVPFCDYLISDRKELLIESYNYDDQLESTLKERIDEMVDFINFVPEFKEAFETHWTVKENKNEEIKKDKRVLIVLEEIRRGLVH